MIDYIEETENGYMDIDDLLRNADNPGKDILDNVKDSQKFILERLGVRDAKFNTMEVSKEIYGIKKDSIIDRSEHGCILTENGLYNPDEGDSNLENNIAKGEPTVGLLFVSNDKKLVNYLPNPEYK